MLDFNLFIILFYLKFSLLSYLYCRPAELIALRINRFYLHLRISDQVARAVGRQLAVIGDELEREWAGQEPQWPLAPLHMLRPAHALTRIVYQ